MSPTALVPIRRAPVAKRRLAHRLDAKERAGLVEDLLRHVTDVLGRVGLRVVVLASQPFSIDGDVEVWTDEAPGLNAALGRAIVRTGLPVLIVHADLPKIETADVEAMLDRPEDVVIARARDGGTNALLLRADLRPSFGSASALAHARRARAAGLRTAVLDRPGLALDVDDAAGLTASSWRPSSRRPSP